MWARVATLVTEALGYELKSVCSSLGHDMNRDTLIGQGVAVSFDVTLGLPGFANLRYMPITTYDVEISFMLAFCGKISPKEEFF